MQVLVPERRGFTAISALRDTSANIAACWDITVWRNKNCQIKTEGDRGLRADVGFLKKSDFQFRLKCFRVSAETLDEQSQCYY